MRKEYQKPDVEIISLITEEKITNDPTIEGAEGDMGVGSNTLFQ